MLIISDISIPVRTIYRLRSSISHAARSIDYTDPPIASNIVHFDVNIRNLKNMRCIDPCANVGSIVRAAQSINYTDPSVVSRKHHVGGEIPRFTKVNVNKVDMFYAIVSIQLAELFYCSFRCILKCTLYQLPKTK